MHIRADFGAKLRAARKAARLTQAQLAAALGTTVKYVKRLERGVENPSLATCVEIAQLCGATFTFDFVEPVDKPRVSLLFAVAGHA